MARFTSNGTCTLGAGITAGANAAVGNLGPSIMLDSMGNCYLSLSYRSSAAFTIPNLDGSSSAVIAVLVF